MECEKVRNDFKNCFMVKTDCRKELHELFNCTNKHVKLNNDYIYPIFKNVQTSQLDPIRKTI